MQDPPLELDLVDRVRRSCQTIVERAEFVSVDPDRVAALALELVIPEPPTSDGAALDPTLIFALDAINFGSGYHDIVRKRPGMSGARTMAAALTEYIGWTGPLTPKRLQAITTHDCSQIFGQELDGGALGELMSLFSSALQDLGYWLDTKGGAIGAIEGANGSAVALAESLTEMPFYDDKGFYKRAQITAADLARDAGIVFHDLDRLSAFADNLVPHVLRVLGVLTYDPTLSATIDHGELLTAGGPEEIEIRAAGVTVVDQLAATMGRRAMDLDLALWTLGGEARFKAVPRHRCRSVFY